MLGELMPQLGPLPHLRDPFPGKRVPEGRPKGRIEQGFFQRDQKRGRGIGSRPQGKVAIGTAVHGGNAIRTLHMVSPHDGDGECFLDGHRWARFWWLASPPSVRKDGLILRSPLRGKTDKRSPAPLVGRRGPRLYMKRPSSLREAAEGGALFLYGMRILQALCHGRVVRGGAPPWLVLSAKKADGSGRGREDDPGAPGALRVHLREHALSVVTRQDAPQPQREIGSCGPSSARPSWLTRDYRHCQAVDHAS